MIKYIKQGIATKNKTSRSGFKHPYITNLVSWWFSESTSNVTRYWASVSWGYIKMRNSISSRYKYE
jgi:hypothetical protein